jgi:hypothetical protein
MEIVKIVLPDKTVTLNFESFDTDLDLDDLTSIHYEDLYGELVTISTLLNKVGLLKADVEEAVKNHDFELSILRAEKMEYYRKQLTTERPYAKGVGTKVEAPSGTEVENNVMMDQAYKIKYRQNITMHKNKEYVESLYWSLKSKDDKLNNLSKSVTPEEFQTGIITGKINTIMINDRKNLLPKSPKL